MMNKRMSPLDGLFDNMKASGQQQMPVGEQLRGAEDEGGQGMESLLRAMQGSGMVDEQQAAAQANPYGETGQMESPEGDMMQDYKEQQRQKMAKNTYLFR
jgi:hypothetical protein